MSKKNESNGFNVRQLVSMLFGYKHKFVLYSNFDISLCTRTLRAYVSEYHFNGFPTNDDKNNVFGKINAPDFLLHKIINPRNPYTPFLYGELDKEDGSTIISGYVVMDSTSRILMGFFLGLFTIVGLLFTLLAVFVLITGRTHEWRLLLIILPVIFLLSTSLYLIRDARRDEQFLMDFLMTTLKARPVTPVEK